MLRWREGKDCHIGTTMLNNPHTGVRKEKRIGREVKTPSGLRKRGSWRKKIKRESQNGGALTYKTSQ